MASIDGTPFTRKEMRMRTTGQLRSTSGTRRGSGDAVKQYTTLPPVVPGPETPGKSVARSKVVIVGAGFGGLTAAQALAGRASGKARRRLRCSGDLRRRRPACEARTIPISSLRKPCNNWPQFRGDRLWIYTATRDVGMVSVGCCARLFPDRYAQSNDRNAAVVIQLRHFRPRGAPHCRF